MVDRVQWDELEPEFLNRWGWPAGKWEPEHLAVLGPTGSGKSYFMTSVIDQRARRGGSSAVILATKPADATVKRLVGRGENDWRLKRTWPPDYGQNKVIFWPPSGRIGEGIQRQRAAVYHFLDELWKPDANIILAFDEIAYVENDLRLRTLVERYWREARSLGITIVATTQRPRNVSRYMHSMPTWSVAFRPDDEDDAKRVAEIIGGRRLYTDMLLSLDPHEFVIVQRREREAYISKLP